MEDGWKRAEDEVCHRCLTAAAVYYTVGLRIRSIIRSRGECAASTRPFPRWSTITTRGEQGKKTDILFVYKSCSEGAEEEETMYSTRQCQHENPH